MFRTDTGFDAEQLAMLGAKAYMMAGGAVASNEEWPQLDDDAQLAWCSVGDKTLHRLEGLDGVKFNEVARRIYGWWAASLGKDAADWDKESLEEQVAWEAAARHLAWCLNCDEPAEGHDVQMWEAWAAEQLEKRR